MEKVTKTTTKKQRTTDLIFDLMSVMTISYNESRVFLAYCVFGIGDQIILYYNKVFPVSVLLVDVSMSVKAGYMYVCVGVGVS